MMKSLLVQSVLVLCLALGCGGPSGRSSSSSGSPNSGAGGGGSSDGSGSDGTAGEGDGTVGEGGATGETGGETGAEGEGEGELVPIEPDGGGDVPELEGDWGHCVVLDSMAIAQAGKGFDLNGDGVKDNALAIAGLVANSELEPRIASGELTILTELWASNAMDNDAFTLNMYTGRDTATGSFDVDGRSYDAAGNPLISFPGATISAGELTATTEAFALAFPVGEAGEEQMFSAVLYKTQMRADVVDGFSRLDEGIIGGAIKKEDLLAAVEAFDTGDIDVGSMIGLLQEDFDTNGDGVRDGYSIALEFTGVGCDFSGEVYDAE